MLQKVEHSKLYNRKSNSIFEMKKTTQQSIIELSNSFKILICEILLSLVIRFCPTDKEGAILLKKLNEYYEQSTKESN